MIFLYFCSRIYYTYYKNAFVLFWEEMGRGTYIYYKFNYYNYKKIK